ncbi:MAG: CRISPR-associated helicase Cas3' [Verrucomicrobiota bacterium]
MTSKSIENDIRLSDCWAKTDPDTGRPNLTVLDHCKTIGVVSEVLYASLAKEVQKQLPQGLFTLIAAHDIGKLTPGFQLKAPKWPHYEQVYAATIHNGLCDNHAAISQWHLANHPHFSENKNAGYWLVSTGGHHGRYPVKCKVRIPSKMRYEGSNDSFASSRNELLSILIQKFGPLPTESAHKEHERIHLLTGFTIFADWIGSNTDWFPPEHPIELKSLKHTAQSCLDILHWKARPQPGLSFGEQFDPSNADLFKPRDIQSCLLDVADSSGLYIVEAPMGMGKTEAALSAAYKRWTSGSEHGLYFALPTQLTSNKIHERIHDFLRNTIGEKTVQTLIHGTAWMKDNESRKFVSPRNTEEYNDTDEALRWYSTTRKQLLAPFGTGTIDQALLAVLPARFAALRYFALAGKVVVIDEVHSFDPYMSKLIDRLIRYLIKAGSTVIILSATLTAARRRQLVEAAGATEATTSDAYPLITKVATGSENAEHFEIQCVLPDKSVRIENQYLPDDAQDYWQGIANQVEAGANVVIIRNTVALAQKTYLELRGLLSANVPAENIGVLHSRFPQVERDTNEAKWTRLLGKKYTERPQGSLLVSTQIVEQSVDIDTDLLVTDLAPIDLVLQRIGRLHRHQRIRPKGFEQACCHILHPTSDWNGDKKAIKATLAPHHYIYPAISLWQSAHYLTQQEAIQIPSQIRQALEQTHAISAAGSNCEAILELEKDAQQKRQAQTGTASIRDVFNAEAIEDREGTETRYGIQPTAHLIILQEAPTEQGNQVALKLLNGQSYQIRTGEFSFLLAKALHQQATRIPAYLVRAQLKAIPEWLGQHIDNGVLAIKRGDDTQLDFVSGTNNGYNLRYRKDLGITHEKNETQLMPSDEEDFWF